ncbi:MarR family winged helix-turn-helix transcriptional regulator [Edaphocola flava]|jgi:DNA-binding MarR family transcriptional regulator|uniref:MarR family winged helix-turn-helix transcriptional regulator n=1 Tax=Edaphocola flava TaxID=2499629 RepID=UPI00100AF831|nr:MarR family transcriptional regulator [Edaphocola flava]
MKLEEVLMTQTIRDSFHKVCLNVIFSGIWIDQKMSPMFKSHGITSAQYNVLRILNGSNTPLTVASIQQRMLFKASNVTRIIDKLLDKGHIKKEMSKVDKRVALVTISVKGKEFLDMLTPKVLDQEHAIMSKNLTEEEAMLLSDLMDKMHD